MAIGNTKQLLEEIQDVLQAATWGASSNVVFAAGSVIVTTVGADTTAQALVEDKATPIALIGAGSASVDPEFGEEPGLLEREIIVRVIQMGDGSDVGQGLMVGAHRGSTTKSEGAGLLDIEAEVFNAIEFLNVGDNSVNIQYVAEGIRDLVIDDSERHIAYVDHVFKADITTDEA